MQHPDFITPERIARICSWPTSDRRHLVKSLSLTDCDGRRVDHKNELAFWRDLLRYLSKGRGAYREIIHELCRLSASGRRRHIHIKCFQTLRTRCPRAMECFDADKADFTRIVCCDGK